MRISVRRVAGWPLRLWAVVVAMWAALAAAQEPTEAALADLFRVELRRQFASDEQLDAALRRFYGVDLGPDQAEAARRTMRALLVNSAVPAHLAKVLKPTFRADSARGDAASLLLRGMVQLQVNGLRRLPSGRQAQFVGHVIDVARAVSPAQCKAGYLGQLSLRESSALEMRYLASQPLRRFEEMLQLYHDAMVAELAGAPAVRTVTAEQARLAQQAMDAASAERVRASLSPQAIARFNKDSSSVPAGEFCAYISASLSGLLEMPEPYKSWQLARFVLDIQ